MHGRHPSLRRSQERMRCLPATARSIASFRSPVTLTRKRDGGHGVLVKLHDDVQTCAYEDVQVMWEMLQRAETERLAREPSPKGARALVWLRRHHKMDPRRRC